MRRRCAPPNSPAAPKASSNPAAMARPPRRAQLRPPRPAPRSPPSSPASPARRAGRCPARPLNELALTEYGSKEVSPWELLSPSIQLGFRISSVLHGGPPSLPQAARGTRPERRQAWRTAGSAESLTAATCGRESRHLREQRCGTPREPSPGIRTLLRNVFLF